MVERRLESASLAYYGSNDVDKKYSVDKHVRMERFIFMGIGTDDAGHPRGNDAILLHVDQSARMAPKPVSKQRRLPPKFQATHGLTG